MLSPLCPWFPESCGPPGTESRRRKSWCPRPPAGRGGGRSREEPAVGCVLQPRALCPLSHLRPVWPLPPEGRFLRGGNSVFSRGQEHGGSQPLPRTWIRGGRLAPRAEAHAGSCVCEERQKLEREPSPQGLGCQRRGRPQRPSGPRGSMSTHRLLCPRLAVLLLRRAGSVRFVPVVSLGADPAWAGLGLNMQETVDRGPGRAGPGAGSGGRACAWAASASYPRPGTERGQGRVRRPWGVRLSGNRVVALRPVVVVRPLCRGREGEAASFAGGAGA